MWVIYVNNTTQFEHFDKYTYALVEDSDIEEFQVRLGGVPHVFNLNALFLQKFVTLSDKVVYARKYIPWSNSQPSDIQPPMELILPETLLAWKSRVEERRPCNNA